MNVIFTTEIEVKLKLFNLCRTEVLLNLLLNYGGSVARKGHGQ